EIGEEAWVPGEVQRTIKNSGQEAASSCPEFLMVLESVTDNSLGTTRENHRQAACMVYFLPGSGFGVGRSSGKFGSGVAALGLEVSGCGTSETTSAGGADGGQGGCPPGHLRQHVR